jgi:3-oxoacyl-[acyl-carrier-protein] synthase-3
MAGSPPRAAVLGVGAYVPGRVLTNHDLARMVDTSDEWITERTGIRTRHVADPDVATSDLAVPAAEEALRSAGVLPEELDLIICATTMPDYLLPARHIGSDPQNRGSGRGSCHGRHPSFRVRW